MEHLTPGIFALLLAGTLATHTTAAAAACEAKSGNTTVPLLELFTSEGCDSCPPADRWVAELPHKGFGLDRVVPLAFHVDYWDYLGWTDRFANSTGSLRQNQFVRRTNAATAYTPQVVLNGKDYRRWRRDDFGEQLQRLHQTPPRADIELRLHHAGTTLQVDSAASARDRSAPAALYVALYENNLQTEVRAGENRGRTLHHAAVVRRLLGPFALDAQGKVSVQKKLALDTEWKTKDMGVAAFVQESNGVAILQALALNLCPSK